MMSRYDRPLVDQRTTYGALKLSKGRSGCMNCAEETNPIFRHFV